MKRTRTALLASLAALLLAFGTVGCDAFEDVFEDEKEVNATVEEVGDGYLTADAIRYEVTSSTEFDEGLTGLSDLAVGDRVEIEYEESGGGRVALEIEPAD